MDSRELLIGLAPIWLVAKVAGEGMERLGQTAVLGGPPSHSGRSRRGGAAVRAWLSAIRWFGHPPLLAVFVGATLTATSVGITARVLADLGRLQGAAAKIVLGAAVVDDILGLIILAIVTGLAPRFPTPPMWGGDGWPALRGATRLALACYG